MEIDNKFDNQLNINIDWSNSRQFESYERGEVNVDLKKLNMEKENLVWIFSSDL
jgi:hypothetical protein